MPCLQSAFYHWFPSKDALIEALAERSAREAFAGVEDAVAGCDGDALARLNAVLQAGFDVDMKIGGTGAAGRDGVVAAPGQCPSVRTHPRGRGALFRPLLTRLISDGVIDGVFDTFDPEGVARHDLWLAARTNSNILDVSQAAGESAREQAIDSFDNQIQTSRARHRPHPRATGWEHHHTDARTGRSDGRSTAAMLLGAFFSIGGCQRGEHARRCSLPGEVLCATPRRTAAVLFGSTDDCADRSRDGEGVVVGQRAAVGSDDLGQRRRAHTTAGVPHASDSSAASPKVSCGPGASVTSAVASSPATASRLSDETGEVDRKSGGLSLQPGPQRALAHDDQPGIDTGVAQAPSASMLRSTRFSTDSRPQWTSRICCGVAHRRRTR